MTIEQILLAEAWQTQFKKIVAILARDETELDAYKQKPDANKKAIEIRTEKNAHTRNFLDLTKDLIYEQQQLLQEANHTHTALQALRIDYLKLQAYAKSKGLDMELLKYMTLKDFGIHNQY